MTQKIRTAIDNGIMVIDLDDPDARVNTVSPEWLDEMATAFARIRDDDAVTGVIITSGKPGFMAGADLKHLLDNPMDAQAAFHGGKRASHLHRLIETCGKPTVAAIAGAALGGGYELALACTRRIASDNPRAIVGLPEINLGLLPGSGGTQRLPRMIGVAKAWTVMSGGKSYGPAEALALGLIDEVVPAASLIEAARAWLASSPDPVRPWDKKGFTTPESDGLLNRALPGWLMMEIAKLRGRYGDNYPAPISLLTCIFEGVQVPIDKGLLVETRHFAKLLADPSSRNIIRTTFINRSLAEKGARRPAGVPKVQFTKVGVLGAGMMGAGIAFCAAEAGMQVVLLDRSVEAARSGKGYSEKILTQRVERGRLAQAGADAILERITPTADYADLAGAEMIVEAVFEDKAIKADVTQKTEAVIGPTCIFASNTSTLPITELARAFTRPGDFIGLHFFSPVDRMALVEVIMGDATSPETLARSFDFIAQLKKVPILVNDRRGFYTSRVFRTFCHEGMEMLREGISPALIENAAKQAGMPVGPLAVIDEIGMGLGRQIALETERDVPGYRRPTAMDVVDRMWDLGRAGRKEGGGFYDYPDNGRKTLWTGLADHFPLADEQPEAAEVKRRILYIQSIETARCLEEGVLTHPADGDLGAVFGWGFPTYLGGTLSMIETVGTAAFVRECDRMAQRYGARFAPPRIVRDMATADQGFDWS